MRQILGREDRDAANRIEQALGHDGVTINCCAQLTHVRREGDETVLTLANESGDTYEQRVDQLLVSVGRKPNVESLDLDRAGVAVTKAGVQVNDRLQTTNKRIYAAGDVAVPYKFTHVADATARIVLQNALFFGRSKHTTLTVPWCTYTDPEIAHVGLNEREARGQGIAIDTYHVPLNEVDRAILDGDEDGLLKVHTRKGKGEIVGGTLVARHAGEMLAELTLAMTNKLDLGAIGKTIHPYPTQTEALKKAADAYSRTRLTPRVKRLFELILKWQR
jgi:pyruvate/2-oxoglutarate dehydrogenase complex dihydrolipoamide dehydrogenase (E3) component